MPRAVVYTLDENNEITSELEMDWDTAVFSYLNKRDHNDHRYYITRVGSRTKFKKKQRKLMDVIRKEPIGDQSRSDPVSEKLSTSDH